MFGKIPYPYFCYPMAPASLAGLAVTVYKPPFSMAVYAVEIIVCAIAVIRGVIEMKIQRAAKTPTL